MRAYKKILREVDDSRQEIIDFLVSLIQIPSINPPGNEEEVAAIIEEKLTKSGIDVKRVVAEQGRPNIIGRVRGTEGTHLLLFNGHMDVVPIGDMGKWWVDPFGARIIDGKVYGRGACDMKGGLAAMMMAGVILRRLDIPLGGDLILTAVVDEEMGGAMGTRYLVEKGLRADAAVVGEPSFDRMTIAHMGNLSLKLISTGKAVHASVPHLGVNAVEKMAKVLLALNEMKLRHVPHRLFQDGPTIAVGTTINGGVADNTIPDYCEATVDVRTLPGMSETEIIGEVKHLIGELKKDDDAIDVKIESHSWAESVEISEGETIVETVSDVVARITGKKPPIASANQTFDGRYLINEAGIPTVAFGPGNGKCGNAHGANEWVGTDDIIMATKIYAITAVEFLGAGKLADD